MKNETSGLKEGWGIYQWHDESTYVGEWKEDMAHGKGWLFYAGGDVYKGDWINDKMGGDGIYLSETNNIRYEGGFKDDHYHGFGKEIWNNG